ncbi:hypothetical protein [Kitasatospora mediocidica]|uniref:hypothetical protein n=1 Tax=Kitasatospora mediocidica TaxID=58352 RepID=UPI00055B471C|nr:hypothetical protein [Kitasatospora mediocidica]
MSRLEVADRAGMAQHQIVEEAALRLVSPYPVLTPPPGARPPGDCYTLSRVGELVHDALNGRPGVFMEQIGPLIYLRPARAGASSGRSTSVGSS